MQRLLPTREDRPKRELNMAMPAVERSPPFSDDELNAELLCAKDSRVVRQVLEPAVADALFHKLHADTSWQTMSHLGGQVPRLVAVQGAIASDGSVPIYRHPSDDLPVLTPFSPAVQLIRERVEEILGHAVNHVLIQCYRSGADAISEHSDKTLDIVPNTFVGNVSLGAQRTLVLRSKKPDGQPTHRTSPSAPAPARQVCRVALSHNSLFVMGLATNQRWLHGIRPDRRPESMKSTAEAAFHGRRISLTFRLIGTFLNKHYTVIWGQGATAKEKPGARPVQKGNTPEAARMIQAFSTENHSTQFAWEREYGSGFDVVNITTGTDHARFPCTQ
ncbi:hypothetical protein K3495_g11967 [Podosphaera aphanis]|nr:hypothetical protein K3495_g11967 [Podosphaera aphanis]